MLTLLGVILIVIGFFLLLYQVLELQCYVDDDQRPGIVGGVLFLAGFYLITR